MPELIIGPGLPVFLRSVPKFFLVQILACTLPTTITRNLPSSAPVDIFLGLPAPIRVFLSYLSFLLAKKAIKKYRFYTDIKRFGPDVVEAPRIEMKWPGNVDTIPHSFKSRMNDYCGELWVPMYEKYGNTFDIGLFGETRIVTDEPENVKAILSTDFASFEKGSTFMSKMGSVLGKGIFNSDGDMWKFHRTMTRPYFSRDRISHFENFARHSDSAISKLLSRLSEPSNPAVDIQDLVARFTLDSGTEFLFGKDVHSLDAPLPYPHSPPKDDSASFAAAFGRAQEQLLIRFGTSVFWPVIEMFWDRTGADMKVINAYVQPILREKLEEKKRLGGTKKVDEEDENDTLLDHLVRYTDDESVIKDEIINILVAGRDTTAATLTFAIYMLAAHPDVMAKLRAEVFEHVGPTGYPTSDNFRDMKYLRAVINETLRLFPAVPINERTSSKSTVFKSGGKTFYIPKGTNTTWSVLSMHRRKDLWGPDADQFDPERWIDDRLKKYLIPNPFIFLPFNAGPRICLGQQFAYNESSFFLVRLLQRVESITLAPEAHPNGTLPPEEWKNATGRKVFEKVWVKSHLTIYSNGGMWVKMKEAAAAE